MFSVASDINMRVALSKSIVVRDENYFNLFRDGPGQFTGEAGEEGGDRL